MLHGLQILRALARRDVLADAAVALEGTEGVEYRLAADPDPYFLAGLVQAAQLQLPERLARVESRDMGSPVRGGYIDVVLIPALLSEPLEIGGAECIRAHSGKRGEAVLVVLLPKDVG